MPSSPSRTYLTRARVVLPDRILEDSAVLLEDGVIAAVEPDGAGGADEIDLSGQILMPGLVDLHCDALEKEVEPRPNVLFPLDFAVAQADKRNAAAGITTVHHALSFAAEELGVRNNALAADVVRSIHDHAPRALVDNRVHCRYEITDESALPVLLELLDARSAHLVSVMDHTPGQGQFLDVITYRDFLTRTYAKSEEEAEALIRRKVNGARGAFDRMTALVAKARENAIQVASHDDDSPQRVDVMHRRLGITISEFPVSLDTARAAREHGLATVFGAPNVLRGRSQIGSMRAADAVQAGVASCLCADYAPATLLAAVFRLTETADIALPNAVRLATLNPALAAGLDDRGEVAAGKRADLLAVSEHAGLPQVTRLWRGGRTRYLADHGV